MQKNHKQVGFVMLTILLLLFYSYYRFILVYCI